MIRRILLPLDGSPRAEAILPHGLALAAVFQARLDLLHVVPDSGGSSGDVLSDPLGFRLAKADRAGYLESLAGELREAGLEVRTRIEEGGAAEVIVDLLRRGEYDAVGLTPHGCGDGRRLRIGCTAVAVILNARTSILLAPVRPPRTGRGDRVAAGYRRLLAPVDCSPRSDWSLGVAAAIARGSGARLKVVHVVRNPEVVSRRPRGGPADALVNRIVEANRMEAERYLDETVWRLNRPDLVVESQVLDARNDPAEAVRDLTLAEDVDLVVMSAHGQGGSAEWPLGGTAAKLVFWAERPVLILQDLPRERTLREWAPRSARALAGDPWSVR